MVIDLYLLETQIFACQTLPNTACGLILHRLSLSTVSITNPTIILFQSKVLYWSGALVFEKSNHEIILPKALLF